MAFIQWFRGFDGVEQFLYGTAILSTLFFGLALALKVKKENWLREYSEAIFVAVWLALGIRATLVEVYSIPSESMVPTLLVKDHLIVSKISYGWHIPYTKGRILAFKKPKRGDIVIFVPPGDTQKSFVKRCVGLPGDVLEVRDKIVHINGKPSEFATSYGFMQDVPAAVKPALQTAYQQLQIENSKDWEKLRAQLKQIQGGPSAQALLIENQAHEWKGPLDSGQATYIVGVNAFHTLIAAKLLDGKKAGIFQTYPKTLRQPEVHAGLGNRDWFGPLTLKEGEYWMMGDDRDNSSDSRIFGPVPEENLRGAPLFRYWPPKRIGLVR